MPVQVEQTSGERLVVKSRVGLAVASIELRSPGQDAGQVLLASESTEEGHSVFRLTSSLASAAVTILSPGYAPAIQVGPVEELTLDPVTTVRIVGFDSGLGLEELRLGPLESRQGARSDSEIGSCGLIAGQQVVAAIDVWTGAAVEGICQLHCELSNGLRFGGDLRCLKGAEVLIDLRSLGLPARQAVPIAIDFTAADGQRVRAEDLDLEVLWLGALGPERRQPWSAMTQAALERAIPALTADYARFGGVPLTSFARAGQGGSLEFTAPGEGHLVLRSRDRRSGSWYAGTIPTSAGDVHLGMQPPVDLAVQIQWPELLGGEVAAELEFFCKSPVSADPGTAKLLTTYFDVANSAAISPLSVRLPRKASEILYHADLGDLGDRLLAGLVLRVPGCMPVQLERELESVDQVLRADFGAIAPQASGSVAPLRLTQPVPWEDASDLEGTLYGRDSGGTLLAVECGCVLGPGRSWIAVRLSSSGLSPSHSVLALRAGGPALDQPFLVIDQHEQLARDLVLVPRNSDRAILLLRNGDALVVQRTVRREPGRLESIESRGNAGEFLVAVWELDGWAGPAGTGSWQRVDERWEFSGLHAPTGSSIRCFRASGAPAAEALPFLRD